MEQKPLTREQLGLRIESLHHFINSDGWKLLLEWMKARDQMAMNAALATKEPYVSSKCLGELALLRDLLAWPHNEAMALKQQLDLVSPSP